MKLLILLELVVDVAAGASVAAEGSSAVAGSSSAAVASLSHLLSVLSVLVCGSKKLRCENRN